MLQYFKKVWFILGSSRSQFAFLILVLLTSSIAEAVGIGLLGPFLAIVSDPSLIQKKSTLSWIYKELSISSSESFVAILCCLITVVFVIKSVAYFYSKFYILYFTFSHKGQTIQILNHAYLNGDYNSFISKNTANLIKNVTYETQNFTNKTLLSLLYGISNFLILLSLILLLIITDVTLLVVTMLAFVPVLLIIYFMRNRLRTWGELSSEAYQKIIKTLNHGLGGFKETRVIGCAPYFEAQMADYANQYTYAISRTISFEMLPRILIETVLVIFIVLFIAISQLFFNRNTDTLVASLGVFAIASIRLLPAASQLMATIGSLQSTRHTVDILYADLKEAKNQIDSLKKNLDSEKQDSLVCTLNFSKKIRLDNIMYRYPGKGDLAINNISLEINKGESIAFIGKSGAGKTTLVDIILGLLNPNGGDILVDGVSIYENLRAWQNLVGYIPQSIFLLDDTIERNVAFGVTDSQINYGRLEQAIAAAQLEDLVSQLPKGIHTRIGERGVMLSGGQRQRVGIARALYHEREILVLDEATSALDTETERRVSEAIQALAGKKTLITIAHRLSTVEHCDRVYLLEKGKVVESGTFKEVVKAHV